MKILFVIPSYEPAWSFGGTVTATVNLCRELARQGIDVTVYTTNADGNGGCLNVPLNKTVLRGEVKVHYFRCNLGRKKAFYSSDLIVSLKNNIHNFDIVHMSAIWQLIGYKTYKICSKSNIPYIVTPHSSLMKHAFFGIGNQLIKRLYWKFFGESVIKNASAIQYLSEGEREESAGLIKNKSFIVPNGIITKEFTTENKEIAKIRRELGIDLNTLLLLYLGRIHPKKQIELIIKSLPSMIRVKKNLKFLIVGNIEDKDYFNSLKKILNDLQLNDFVIWKNQVSNDEVKYYYSSADLMVLPSKLEGVSMALTEAMSAGLPLLISNRVANYKEIEIDKSGIIVEPSLESTKNALISVAKGEIDIKKMGENAYFSAKNRYEIRNVATQMIDAYNDIINHTKNNVLNWSS